MFYWIGVAVVAAIALDFGIVAWRNRAALRVAAGAAVPSQAAGFLPVVGFGAVGVALELAKVFFGVGRTVAADAGGVVAAAIGIIPGVLEALKNPLIAALLFGVIGFAAGGRVADSRNAVEKRAARAAVSQSVNDVKAAIAAANARADAAIKDAIEKANKRADEAIAKAKEAASKQGTNAKAKR